MSATDVLNETASMVCDFEGFSSVAYLCPAGVPTIGYGSTHDYRLAGHPRVTMSTPPVNKQVALGWVKIELQASLETVEATHVALTEHQEAALCDFVYNLGSGAFMGSTLRKDLVNGDFAAAANEFEKWDHAGGEVLAGLLRRRLAEKAEFEKAA